MTVTRVAKTEEELADLVGDMIEIEHPTLDLQYMCLENGVLIIPTVIPDHEPAFEWEESPDQEGYLHVYRCRKARLFVDNIEAFDVMPDTEFVRKLLDIRYQCDTVSIYEDYSCPLIQVRVNDLKVVLEVSDEVVDILTLYEMPGGGQILGYGDDMLKHLCQEAGIAPPDIQKEVEH
ncbi:MAG: hypothetical protein ACYC27_20220 [Armatimonadota bacterium]